MGKTETKLAATQNVIRQQQRMASYRNQQPGALPPRESL